MGSDTTPYCREPTTALRMHSPELLRADLGRIMLAYEPDVAIDFRDVLVGLAVYVDCARRIGVDPIAMFDAAAADRSSAMRDLAATFVRRSDITLEAFGWCLEDHPDGPCYRPIA